MVYGFEPVPDRRVIESSPMVYLKSEARPSRTLEFHDLFYMVDGFWTADLAEERIELKPGDVAMLPAGLPRYGRSLCSPNSRTIYIHFKAKKGFAQQDRPKCAAMRRGKERSGFPREALIYSIENSD